MTATAGAAIEQDLTCGGCDYNLRGLPRDGACPECGHAVTATLLGRSRRQAAWLRRISLGAMLIGAGILVGGLGAAARGLLPTGGRWLLYAFPAGAVVGAIGTWLFATRGPHERGHGYAVFWICLRVLAMATCLLQLYVTLVVARVTGFMQVQFPSAGRLVELCEATAAIWAATAALTLLRAAIVAGRVEDPTGRVQACLLGICTVALLGGGAMYWNTLGEWMRAYMAALAVLAGWSIVFFLGFAIVLWRRVGAAARPSPSPAVLRGRGPG
jgi:hypothetical protein